MIRQMMEEKETQYEAVAAKILLSDKSRSSMSGRPVLGSMAPVPPRNMECFTATVASTLKIQCIPTENIGAEAAVSRVHDVQAGMQAWLCAAF